MCEFCDKLNTISTKHPIQITCHWADNNHNSSITSDLSKCTIEILLTLPGKFPSAFLMTMKSVPFGMKKTANGGFRQRILSEPWTMKRTTPKPVTIGGGWSENWNYRAFSSWAALTNWKSPLPTEVVRWWMVMAVTVAKMSTCCLYWRVSVSLRRYFVLSMR